MAVLQTVCFRATVQTKVKFVTGTMDSVLSLAVKMVHQLGKASSGQDQDAELVSVEYIVATV